MTPLSETALTGAADVIDRLRARLDPGSGRLGVAFSGGVDSSVLLALAAEALGTQRVTAVLAVSPSLAEDERSAAHAVAAQLGVRLVEVTTEEHRRAAYRANGPDRCYHCKDELFTRIDDAVVVAHRLAAIAYGENADDVVRIDRPGARAATEHGVLRPLADAGLTKDAVRAIARDRGLPCADKPAAPCLASRIPHFTPVTRRRLAQVEQAERALRRLGFAENRVRHHGATARIEVPAADLTRMATEPLHSAVVDAVRAAGFDEVVIDERGLRSGALTMAALAAATTTGGGHD